MAKRKRSTSSTPRKGRGDPALGLRIRKLRTKLGLSQEALGQHVCRHENWVYLVERGDAEPGYFDLLHLAEALGVDLVRLLGDDDPEEAARSSHASAVSQRRLISSPDPAMMVLDPSAAGMTPDQWLEEMRRRAFLRAMATLTGATAAGWWPGSGSTDQLALATLREALVGDPRGDVELPSVVVLQRSVADLWTARQQSRYSFVLAQAPILLRQTRLAASALTGDEQFIALASLAAIYQAITGVLRKMGDLHLAAIAADRAMGAACQHGSATAIADSTRFFSLVLGDAGHHDQAVRICTAAADRLESEELRPANPSSVSIYGQLLLTAAGAAAKGGDRALTEDLFRRADAVAGLLGADANHHHTAFGPTNITVHRVHTSVVLGDGDGAVRRARSLDLSKLPVLERRAHHLLDVAFGYHLIDKPEQATTSLLTAERVAAEEVRYDPRARLLVEQLRVRNQSISIQLDALARRMQPLHS